VTLPGQIVGGAPVGNNPASDGVVLFVWLLAGVGLPVLFLLLRLEVEVSPNAVTIRFAPLFIRVIDQREIAGAEPVTYRPLGEFGGWGVRGWGARVAYNVRGNQGVELTLTDGRRAHRHPPRRRAGCGHHPGPLRRRFPRCPTPGPTPPPRGHFALWRFLISVLWVRYGK
jgi:hypothetical protein